MHPLAPDLTKLTDEELHKNHGDLHNKLVFAFRMGNADLCEQLRLLLDDYQSEVERRNLKMFEDAQKNGRNFSNKIDITK